MCCKKSAYRELLYRIHGKDKNLRPEIAANPFSDNTLVGKIETNVKIEKAMFASTELSGRVNFQYNRNN